MHTEMSMFDLSHPPYSGPSRISARIRSSLFPILQACGRKSCARPSRVLTNDCASDLSDNTSSN